MFIPQETRSPKVFRRSQVLDARYIERACGFEYFRSGKRVFISMTPEQQAHVIGQAWELQEEK